MTLRELIEAKQRRTAKLPILIGDLSAAAAEVATVQAALGVLERMDGDDAERQARVKKLQAQLKKARERQAACVVEVELQALPADEWEALVGPLEPDESGELDLSEIHSLALAASCTAEELQDADWWAEQLRKPHWSQGDRAQISSVLMELNWFAPTRAPGKG